MTSDHGSTDDVPHYGTQMARDAAHQSPRADSGLTGIAEQRLNALAIKRGWLRGQRWGTEVSQDELEALRRPLTAKETALLSAIKGAKSSDPRVQQAAVANLVKMEAQNQRDDAEPASPAGTTGNLGVVFNQSGVTPAQVAAELILSGEWRKLDSPNAAE